MSGIPLFYSNFDTTYSKVLEKFMNYKSLQILTVAALTAFTASKLHAQSDIAIQDHASPQILESLTLTPDTNQYIIKKDANVRIGPNTAFDVGLCAALRADAGHWRERQTCSRCRASFLEYTALVFIRPDAECPAPLRPPRPSRAALPRT